MRRLRQKLPKTGRFGDEETRILYNRYSAMKNKAESRGETFPWPKFAGFLEAILSVAPAGYAPSSYHIAWGDNGRDYRAEAIQFRRVNEPKPADLVVELAILLAGLEPEEPIQLADLVNAAAINAAA